MLPVVPLVALAFPPELETTVLELMDAGHLPGLAVAVVDTDRVVFSGALGMAELETSTPFTVDTGLCIGSVSKPVTATAVMQLVECGAIALDDCVSAHIEFPLVHPSYPDEALTVPQGETSTPSAPTNPSTSTSQTRASRT